MDDSCTTDDQRKKNLPTDYFTLFQTTSCATYICTVCDNNALVLVDQVGLWICFTIDNVVLTLGCCYRCNATTATPATTSKFDDKDVDGVRDEAGGRPRSSC